MTSLSIDSHRHSFVVGVDTHPRNHVYASHGALLDAQSVPATAAGINQAIKWVAHRTNADADTRRVIERAASYGAILAGNVANHVARRMAKAVLPLPVERSRSPRLNEGIRQGLWILVTAREFMAKDRTRPINALNALVRSNDLGIDAGRKLTPVQIEEISRGREREQELALRTGEDPSP